ncbi:hypothetical protein ABB37_00832 [Leptomonas pyrrhocoris]|uniref:Transmembrane protein n=1 Tax=Leptomonas pyrrhocoris TaxID=157538 RepID=A0A0M9GB80_LEPPY|nr:hypothetical protein ABB37_00832 [Leptomonas pyrrhocoris]XP_015665197.1 hypothetical protein ABB37_00832 [Leptomonas pyrrhocoris]XP_015665198.1 hypothetical protein ABB37_00832 [Leptomonas pyrrhocoris]KPA86757.1 hypothetical protein ABB37_00832 [Leptomonas pyrrhocoris]KPA86758.1 hypothetical protein ABB37_00832 [Leptomonas pyrrhocoris]KPA86759.1 hypothetical protein ABB37_00832 [Leptomonas pyrrhocoris]|eukprot:XP_015665196.1 hypothetical protein ABB37_00832 [Leptomonas pyrrhocoris]
MLRRTQLHFAYAEQRQLHLPLALRVLRYVQLRRRAGHGFLARPVCQQGTRGQRLRAVRVGYNHRVHLSARVLLHGQHLRHQIDDAQGQHLEGLTRRSYTPHVYRGVRGAALPPATPPPTTSRKPQPTFVNGFKTLTWAQSHWWVIFLIIALVLLVLLFAVIVYCCIASIKPKKAPPLHAMVLRERMGKAYVLADSPLKSRNGSKDLKLANGAYTQQQMSVDQQRQQQEAQRRLGRGFNPQERRQNPEDMTMGAAGIFGRGGRNQYGDGNMVDDDGRQKGDEYYANVRGGGLHEDELARTEPRPGDDAASVGASVTASKRRSSRRSRRRTVSQTFEDVDVPQAGEISELNVDL